MLQITDLITSFERNLNIVKSQTKGLTNEESLLQLPFQGNCMNWVLGHIADNRDAVLSVLGESPVLGERNQRYTRGSEPLTHAEPGSRTLQELLDWLEQSQIRLAQVLGKLDETALAREITVGDRKVMLAQRLFFLYFHETYHVGQTEIFRQLAGKNDKVI